MLPLKHKETKVTISTRQTFPVPHFNCFFMHDVLRSSIICRANPFCRNKHTHTHPQLQKPASAFGCGMLPSLTIVSSESRKQKAVSANVSLPAFSGTMLQIEIKLDLSLPCPAPMPLLPYWLWLLIFTLLMTIFSHFYCSRRAWQASHNSSSHVRDVCICVHTKW